MGKRLLEAAVWLATGAGLLYGVIAAPDAAPAWVLQSPLTAPLVPYWWLVLAVRPVALLLGVALIVVGLLVLIGIDRPLRWAWNRVFARGGKSIVLVPDDWGPEYVDLAIGCDHTSTFRPEGSDGTPLDHEPELERMVLLSPSGRVLANLTRRARWNDEERLWTFIIPASAVRQKFRGETLTLRVVWRDSGIRSQHDFLYRVGAMTGNDARVV